MTITLKSLTTSELTLNDYASIAADALAAINAINQAWRDNARRGGYAKHFVSAPQINDELHLVLLTQIVDFDEDPRESLVELNFQNEPRDRDYPSYNPPKDHEWDYAVAKGFAL